MLLGIIASGFVCVFVSNFVSGFLLSEPFEGLKLGVSFWELIN